MPIDLASVIYNSGLRGAKVGWGVACECAGVNRQCTLRRALACWCVGMRAIPRGCHGCLTVM